MENYIKYSVSDCDDKELEITKVFVSPEQRGNGIGKKLVQEAIDYAKEKGYKTVGLYAYPQTKDSLTEEQLINWYSSMGFESDADDSCLMTYYIQE